MVKKKEQPPDNPVTQGDADAFVIHVKQWQDRLNLNDWRIERSPKAAAKANKAEVNHFDLEARLATYRIGKDFGSEPVTAQSVEETACHEVLHVFLYELLQAAQDRSMTAESLNSIEHRVIQSLVRVLVPEV